ncbi:ABC transporter ATP-binding protein [Streptomyces sp. TS71-3]|uniref:ABC transporter ATP-binding protein n=1 Tax=Streptomyces sp. TS71-3 TaxID=2733862 RepID=UPI001B163ECC|nr:ABC transporter ATP-binding protein [Streptomyces sp. TS71-3]GHJ42393.1 multidrug ABC transporter ATP-binding protein [Streptomyces sp. TS71-3]
MIEVRNLTKSYGSTLAVDGLSFDVRPGRVTGFLGPNGSGKSTTMRMIMGLDAPDTGEARIGGRAYRDLAWPLSEVGALLEARTFHPGRSARHHLSALAAGGGIPPGRVGEVLRTVGLGSVAHRRAGKFSLGMAQRLGIAAALLGDPPILLFDEPVNGLDPEGVRWIRNLMTSLAAEGRTVLLSSHLISEMALTADHLVVIGRGRLLADTTVRELTRGGGSLEDAFFRLTGESAEYHGSAPAPRAAGADPGLRAARSVDGTSTRDAAGPLPGGAPAPHHSPPASSRHSEKASPRRGTAQDEERHS